MTITDNAPLYENDAHLIAENYLAAMKLEVEDFELVLLTKETIEKDYGWVFFYQTKEWVESGDSSAMLAGNAPFLVERRTGRIVVFGTDLPVEEYLKKYEEGLAL